MSNLKSKLAIASGAAGLLLAAFMTVKDISQNLSLSESDKPKEPIQEETLTNQETNELNLHLPENN